MRSDLPTKPAGRFRALTSGMTLAACLLYCCIGMPARTAQPTVAALRQDGAFGFPQSESLVYLDEEDLRFSVWSNKRYLLAQAILWTDDSDAIGEPDERGDVGDRSYLLLDMDGNRDWTANVDRFYSLNDSPSLPGLSYRFWIGQRVPGQPRRDSHGQGAIRYIKIEDGKTVRVDTFLIPLSELQKEVGNPLKLSYFGVSGQPHFTVNSVGYVVYRKQFFHYNIAFNTYHEFALAEGHEIDTTRIPEDRTFVSRIASTESAGPGGEVPLKEIAAQKWFGSERPVTLAAAGKPVVVLFWAPWCAACIPAMDFLDEVQRTQGDRLQIVGLAAEAPDEVEQFLKHHPVGYPVGSGSSNLDECRVPSLPFVVVVNKERRTTWYGTSGVTGLRNEITKALE